MKIAKKLFSILLILTLLCAAASTAFAVEITIDDTGAAEGNKYEAYKLLNATNAVDEENKATDKFAYTLNKKYEDSIKRVVFEGLPTEKKPADAASVTEAQVIAYISELDDSAIRAFADAVYAEVKSATADYTTSSNKFDNVDQGYYLIAEIDTQAHPDTVSLVMLDTAGVEAVTVETKESVPSVEKKVKDTDDSTGVMTSWQDSADYDIGDIIPYQITGTVSEEIANYNTYYYKFTDTMTHLTYNSDAKVYLVNGSTKTEITSYFTASWNPETKVLTLTCADLKLVDGVAANSKIVVEYTATLDADAIIGSEGNPNTVTLTYSRDPYHSGEGNPTNETPRDTNIVFTFKGVVNKVDSEKKQLTGAGFTLFKWKEVTPAQSETSATYDWVAVGEECKGEAMTTFEFNGLDAGQYKLVETTVPAGYNKADDIEFVIEAVHDENSDDPTLTSLVVKNGDGDTISGDTLTFAANVSEGTVSTDVVNNSGFELPSTGGIGTTIFYIVGGILAVGAGVLLIVNKRMSNVQ